MLPVKYVDTKTPKMRLKLLQDNCGHSREKNLRFLIEVPSPSSQIRLDQVSHVLEEQHATDG